MNHVEIRGADTIVNGLEDCIAHLIMANFERKMSSGGKQQNRLIELQSEIDYFNDQLRFPFGQICNIEKNLEAKTNIKLYYAIKSLPGLITNIENEIYTLKLSESNVEFNHLWTNAKKLVSEWLFKLKTFERSNSQNISMSTLVLLLNDKKIDPVKETNECFTAIKTAWQTIWDRFNIVRSAFRFVTNNSNSEFDVKLTKTEPLKCSRDYFFLAIDNHQHVRLFARAQMLKYKARPANRTLKWVKVDELITETIPTWWISVTRKPPSKLIPIKEESDSDRNHSRNDSTIYNA
jgi:hypothetical protein